jgi:hypothetical protein
MANLNQNMEVMLGDIQNLLSFGIRHELVTVYQNKVEELRSWINSEILEFISSASCAIGRSSANGSEYGNNGIATLRARSP